MRLILELEEMLTDVKVSSTVRDTVIDLFTKNLMHMDGGLPRGWSWRFVEDRGNFSSYFHYFFGVNSFAEIFNGIRKFLF